MKRPLIALAAAVLLAGPALSNDSAPITAIEDAQRGTMVTLQGVVDRITDEDEFRLRDATGVIRVYVGPNWVPADLGEQVTVDGFVDDDFGPREVYARSLTRADGTVVTFSRRYD